LPGSLDIPGYQLLPLIHKRCGAPPTAAYDGARLAAKRPDEAGHWISGQTYCGELHS